MIAPPQKIHLSGIPTYVQVALAAREGNSGIPRGITRDDAPTTETATGLHRFC
jgi:hypothetical protein